MKKYTKNRRKICAFLLCVIFAIFLGGCDDIEYTKTDREYYRTHTGTENEGFNLPRLETATEVSKEEADKEEESEPGVITPEPEPVDQDSENCIGDEGLTY